MTKPKNGRPLVRVPQALIDALDDADALDVERGHRGGPKAGPVRTMALEAAARMVSEVVRLVRGSCGPHEEDPSVGLLARVAEARDSMVAAGLGGAASDSDDAACHACLEMMAHGDCDPRGLAHTCDLAPIDDPVERAISLAPFELSSDEENAALDEIERTTNRWVPHAVVMAEVEARRNVALCPNVGNHGRVPCRRCGFFRPGGDR